MHENFLKYLKKWLSISNVAVVVMSFVLGWIIASYQVNDVRKSDLFLQTWTILSERFIDREAIVPEKMLLGATRGVLTSIGDPSTMLLTREEKEVLQEFLSRRFEGIGVQLARNNNNDLVVYSIFKGSPAEKSEIKKGDKVISINGENTAGMSPLAAQSLLKARKGSQLSIGIYDRESSQARIVSLLSHEFKVTSVESQQILTVRGKRFTYIKVSGFTEETIMEWNKIFSTINLDDLDGLVLDIRDNHGGIKEVPIFIASEFIESGDLYLVEDRKGIKPITLTSHEAKLRDTPLVVLINRSTVSSAELLAAIFQYSKKGILVGERTFGKNTIQDFFDLSSEVSMVMTTSRWYMPNNETIAGKGLSPDIYINPKNDESGDAQLNEALNILDKF